MTRVDRMLACALVFLLLFRSLRFDLIFLGFRNANSMPSLILSYVKTILANANADIQAMVTGTARHTLHCIQDSPRTILKTTDHIIVVMILIFLLLLVFNWRSYNWDPPTKALHLAVDSKPKLLNKPSSASAPETSGNPSSTPCSAGAPSSSPSTGIPKAPAPPPDREPSIATPARVSTPNTFLVMPAKFNKPSRAPTLRPSPRSNDQDELQAPHNRHRVTTTRVSEPQNEQSSNKPGGPTREATERDEQESKVEANTSSIAAVVKPDTAPKLVKEDMELIETANESVDVETPMVMARYVGLQRPALDQETVFAPTLSTSFAAPSFPITYSADSEKTTATEQVVATMNSVKEDKPIRNANPLPLATSNGDGSAQDSTPQLPYESTSTRVETFLVNTSTDVARIGKVEKEDSLMTEAPEASPSKQGNTASTSQTVGNQAMSFARTNSLTSSILPSANGLSSVAQSNIQGVGLTGSSTILPTQPSLVQTFGNQVSSLAPIAALNSSTLANTTGITSEIRDSLMTEAPEAPPSKQANNASTSQTVGNQAMSFAQTNSLTSSILPSATGLSSVAQSNIQGVGLTGSSTILPTQPSSVQTFGNQVSSPAPTTALTSYTLANTTEITSEIRDSLMTEAPEPPPSDQGNTASSSQTVGSQAKSLTPATSFTSCTLPHASGHAFYPRSHIHGMFTTGSSTILPMPPAPVVVPSRHPAGPFQTMHPSITNSGPGALEQNSKPNATITPVQIGDSSNLSRGAGQPLHGQVPTSGPVVPLVVFGPTATSTFGTSPARQHPIIPVTASSIGSSEVPASSQTTKETPKVALSSFTFVSAGHAGASRACGPTTVSTPPVFTFGVAPSPFKSPTTGAQVISPRHTIPFMEGSEPNSKKSRALPIAGKDAEREVAFDEEGLKQLDKVTKAFDPSFDVVRQMMATEGDPNNGAKTLNIYSTKLNALVLNAGLVTSSDALTELRRLALYMKRHGHDGAKIESRNAESLATSGRLPVEIYLSMARATTSMARFIIDTMERDNRGTEEDRTTVMQAGISNIRQVDRFWLNVDTYHKVASIVLWRPQGEGMSPYDHDPAINPLLIQGITATKTAEKWMDEPHSDDKVMLVRLRSIYDARSMVSTGALERFKANYAPELYRTLLAAGQTESAEELRAQYQLGPEPFPLTTRPMLDLWTAGSRGSWKTIPKSREVRRIPLSLKIG